MDARWIGLCLLLILCSDFGSWTVMAGISNPRYKPRPAIRGIGKKLVLSCIIWSRPKYETFIKLILTYAGLDQAVMTRENGHVATPGSMARSRGYLESDFNNGEGGHLTLVLNDTLCFDEGKELKCTLHFETDGYRWPPNSASMRLDVEAPPVRAPISMIMSPPSKNVKEHSLVTFTCSGNVGRPAGVFQWYTLSSSDTGPGKNRTSESQQGTATQASFSGDDSCTFKRTSTLTFKAARMPQDETLVVRCRVSPIHLRGTNLKDLPYKVGADCTDPDTYFCQEISNIYVWYGGEYMNCNKNGFRISRGVRTILKATLIRNTEKYRWYYKVKGSSVEHTIGFCYPKLYACHVLSKMIPRFIAYINSEENTTFLEMRRRATAEETATMLYFFLNGAVCPVEVVGARFDLSTNGAHVPRAWIDLNILTVMVLVLWVHHVLL